MNQTRSLAAVYFTHFPYFYFILIYIYSLSLSLSLSLYLRHRQKRSDSFSLCFQFDFIRFDFNFLILLLFVWLNAAAIFFRLYPSSPLPPTLHLPNIWNKWITQLNDVCCCPNPLFPPLPPSPSLIADLFDFNRWKCYHLLTFFSNPIFISFPPIFFVWKISFPSSFFCVLLFPFVANFKRRRRARCTRAFPPPLKCWSLETRRQKNRMKENGKRNDEGNDLQHGSITVSNGGGNRLNEIGKREKETERTFSHGH